MYSPLVWLLTILLHVEFQDKVEVTPGCSSWASCQAGDTTAQFRAWEYSGPSFTSPDALYSIHRNTDAESYSMQGSEALLWFSCGYNLTSPTVDQYGAAHGSFSTTSYFVLIVMSVYQLWSALFTCTDLNTINQQWTHSVTQRAVTTTLFWQCPEAYIHVFRG